MQQSASSETYVANGNGNGDGNGHGNGAPALGKRAFWALTFGSIGVVYGDIGTSPLYALRVRAATRGTRGGGRPAIVPPHGQPAPRAPKGETGLLSDPARHPHSLFRCRSCG